VITISIQPFPKMRLINIIAQAEQFLELAQRLLGDLPDS
jgi:hypothetical protein